MYSFHLILTFSALDSYFSAGRINRLFIHILIGRLFRSSTGYACIDYNPNRLFERKDSETCNLNNQGQVNIVIDVMFEWLFTNDGVQYAICAPF